jgi:Group 4 capsule polysaccharide lipoprotein gfcB, YjbF
VLTAAAGLCMTGCAHNPILQSVSAATGRITGLPRDVKIDRATIAKIPYATIRARFGDGLTSLLLLRTDDDSELNWVASDNTLLVTRSGRLIKTVGFPEDLRRIAFDRADPLSDAPQALTGPARYAMKYDLMTTALNVIQVASDLEPVGDETITIAEIDFKTVHLRERCRAASPKWTFQNDYWVDAFDGFVWRSRQHFARSLPPLTIEVLKPAA